MDVYHNDNDINYVSRFNSECIISSKVPSPFFSIIIPAYKRDEILKQTIDSALDQNTNIDYEIVIVDDYPQSRSYDNVIKYIDSNKLSYYINEINIGQYNNINKCIQLARGKYVVLLLDDDILAPDFLYVVYKAILSFNYPGILGVNYKTFNDTISFINNDKEIYYRNVTKKSFFFGRYINVTGMTFKRSVAVEIGGFKRKYYPIQDSVFIYNVICNYKCVYIDNVLAGYRIGLNLSLRDDVMIKTVLYMNECRKSIADNEKFAKLWMILFGREYLALYVEGANNKWNKNINVEDILEEAGYSNKINVLKYKLMKIALKCINYSDRIINRKRKIK